MPNLSALDCTPSARSPVNRRGSSAEERRSLEWAGASCGSEATPDRLVTENGTAAHTSTWACRSVSTSNSIDDAGKRLHRELAVFCSHICTNARLATLPGWVEITGRALEGL